MRILLIEDERRLANVIKKGLTEDGFAVDQAFDGEEGLYLSESETYDLIILDLMLPKMDGLKVCHEIRRKKIKTPILMLTAKTKVEDRVKGLEMGSDDYLTKPFAYTELKARIQALIRRSHHEADPILKFEDLEVDPAKHKVIRGGKTISLTPKEFAILEYILRNKGNVITRTQVTEHVWDYNFDALSNVVDVFVATLRRKINKGFNKKLIKTVHGVGYKI
ncbi:response regulator transcription factor [Patescibacteria group bacterium]|nr:response regulator transcription factor [Patescibacteria group bacterium]